MAVGNVVYTPRKALYPSDIINTLESTAEDLPLSAAQGSILKNQIRYSFECRISATSKEDLNTMTTPGLYKSIIHPTAVNSPGYYCYLYILKEAPSCPYKQIAVGYNTNQIATRHYNSTSDSWTQWEKYITKTDLENQWVVTTEIAGSQLDANNLTEPGLSPYLLRPDNKNGPPFVAYLIIINWRSQDSTIKQIAVGYNTHRIATRHRYNGIWSDWKEIQYI